MQRALQQFRLNLDNVRDLAKIFDLLENSFPILKNEADELLRAEIVLAVSAFDSFIHDVVRVGMTGLFLDSRFPTSASFNQFSISLEALQKIEFESDRNNKSILFESEIRRINSKDSFQSPKNVEYALGLINVDKIWTKVAPIMSIPAQDIKNRLALIVDRRNKIAHEADFDFVNGTKYPIDEALTKDVVNFVEKLGEAIYSILQS